MVCSGKNRKQGIIAEGVWKSSQKLHRHLGCDIQSSSITATIPQGPASWDNYWLQRLRGCVSPVWREVGLSWRVNFFITAVTFGRKVNCCEYGPQILNHWNYRVLVSNPWRKIADSRDIFGKEIGSGSQKATVEVKVGKTHICSHAFSQSSQTGLSELFGFISLRLQWAHCSSKELLNSENTLSKCLFASY